MINGLFFGSNIMDFIIVLIVLIAIIFWSVLTGRTGILYCLFGIAIGGWMCSDTQPQKSTPSFAIMAVEKTNPAPRISYVPSEPTICKPPQTKKPAPFDEQAALRMHYQNRNTLRRDVYQNRSKVRSTGGLYEPEFRSMDSTYWQNDDRLDYIDNWWER
jgi:hypothetical protein